MNTTNSQDGFASNKGDMQWEIDVPIFGNSVIIRDLAIAIGIPFGTLIVFLLIVSGGDLLGSGVAYALGLIGLLFLLTYVFIMVVYGGNYSAGFMVNDEGILNYTQRKHAKRNKIVNSLLIVLGLLSRKPTTVGIGIIAQSSQSVFIKWNRIKKVNLDPKTKTIVIRGGFAEKVAVFCTDENYSDVSALVMSKLRDNKAGTKGS